MSPSSGLRARIPRWLLQLARLPGFALAFVLAGVFVGPWSTPPTPPGDDPQVLAVAAHEVASECQETPVDPQEPEDEEDLLVLHAPAHPPSWLGERDAVRAHDALGPPTHCPDVETPPPRA